MDTKNKFTSKKRMDGYSTCFRQWKAEDTHCKYLHGYSIYFDITFEGDLDYRNWVADFGLFKRAKSKMYGMSPNEYFNYLLDHTTVVAVDDPYLEQFREMDKDGIIQLRILPAVGCERFAEYLFNTIDDFLLEETKGRVSVVKVEVYEHERNAASYERK